MFKDDSSTVVKLDSLSTDTVKDLWRLSRDEMTRQESEAEAMRDHLRCSESLILELQNRLERIQEETRRLLAGVSTSQVTIGDTSPRSNPPVKIKRSHEQVIATSHRPPASSSKKRKIKASKSSSSEVAPSVNSTVQPSHKSSRPVVKSPEARSDLPRSQVQTLPAPSQAWRMLEHSTLEFLLNQPGPTSGLREPYPFRPIGTKVASIRQLLQNISHNVPLLKFLIVNRFYDQIAADESYGYAFVLLRPEESLNSNGDWMRRDWVENRPVSLIGRLGGKDVWKYFGQYQSWNMGSISIRPDMLLGASSRDNLVLWIQSSCMPDDCNPGLRRTFKQTVGTQYSKAGFQKGVCIVGYRYVGWSPAAVDKLGEGVAK